MAPAAPRATLLVARPVAPAVALPAARAVRLAARSPAAPQEACPEERRAARPVPAVVRAVLQAPTSRWALRYPVRACPRQACLRLARVVLPVDRAAADCRARVAAEAAAVPRAVRQVVAERLAAVVCRTWAHPEAAPRTKASSEVQAAAVVEPRAQLALLAAQRAVRPVVRKACRVVLQVGPQVARPALVECRVEVPRAVVVP